MNADIGDLNRRVDPLQGTGSQRINGDDYVGFRTVDDPLYDFAGFNSRDAQHTRSDRTDRAVPWGHLVRRQLEIMPGHDDILHNQWSERIRRNIPVAQTHNEDRSTGADTDFTQKGDEFLGKS